MLIEEIADICGMPIVEALIVHYGGRRITIPKRKPIYPLQVAGLNDSLLRREFGGIAVRVPKRRPLTRSIVLKRSPIDLAAEYKVSIRTINRKIRQARS